MLPGICFLRKKDYFIQIFKYIYLIYIHFCSFWSCYFEGAGNAVVREFFLAIRTAYRGLILNLLNMSFRKYRSQNRWFQIIDLQLFMKEKQLVGGEWAMVSKLFTPSKIYFVMWR